MNLINTNLLHKHDTLLLDHSHTHCYLPDLQIQILVHWHEASWSCFLCRQAW